MADSDPTPGDPYGVAGAGRWCQDTFLLLTSIADRLGKVCTDDFWKSDAGLEFSTLVTSVAARARAASHRFEEAAGAFGTTIDGGYAGALSTVQSTADKAYSKARSAQDEIDAYRRTHPLDGAGVIGLTPTLPGQLPPAEMFNPKLVAAEQDISDARSALAGATALRDEQAAAAARRLNRVVSADGISDGGTPLAPGETFQSRLAAYDDAEALAQALKNPNDPASRATIDRVGKDLAAHQNDPGFLADFFGTAPDIGGLARALSTGGGDGLDPQAQGILSEYGTALAAATKSGQLPPSVYSYQGDGPDVEWIRNDASTTDGGPEAMFLVAAGMPPIRDGSDPYAMSAALNVMSTAADIQEQHPDWIPLDPVKNALTLYTSTYVDDLALSVSASSRGLIGSPPAALITSTDVTSLLKFAYGTNDETWRQFRTGVANELVDSVAAQSGKPQSAPLVSYEDLSKLYGATNSVENGWTMDIATSLDADANNRLILANAALGAYGNLSLNGPTHEVMQPVSGAVSPILAKLAPDWFATNHVQTATDAINQANMGQDVSLEVLTAKALLKSGELSKDQFTELSSVMPTSPTDTNAFIGWYTKHENDPKWGINGQAPAGIYGLMQQQFDRRS